MAGLVVTSHIQTEPATRTQQAINETIQAMKNKGLIQKPRNRANTKSWLNRIARETDIFNPIKVKNFIANKIPLPLKTILKTFTATSQKQTKSHTTKPSGNTNHQSH